MFTIINGIDIPLVSVGTSPFFGAAQFGRKARDYRRKFLNDTEAILEILRASYKAGGRGIQLVPGGKINEAATVMKETHDDFVITGSTFPGPDPKIDQLVDLGAKIIFAHGSVADRQDERLVNMLEEISSRGVIPGIALHTPIETLEFITEQELEVAAILVPFNANGLYMGEKKRLEKMVDRLDQYSFIGMKTLAAGKLDPEKAYSYIQKHNICAVAIGMVSTSQAEESTKIALSVLKKE
jgi:hypothetical protein